MAPKQRNVVFCSVLAAIFCCALRAAAEDMPGVVLDLRFTPAPRSQIAVWMERQDGRFLRTLALTEAVAFRGIGNRPGASQMNSGYRWPYGRREGVLPIWASRRAAAPGAQPWKRVIFQDRSAEGRASQTSADQSVEDYFCLSFMQATTTRDALDAVSCASVFNSDKGRFITQADVSAGYHEPWENPATGIATTQALPLTSLYPPRMDVTRCTSGCYDHIDLASFVTHAREVMPDIDAVTMATPPGNMERSLLFSLPPDWPLGSYALWVEVSVEGDYNATYDDTTYPTPTGPAEEWDSWAITYGYPYRGQPSIAFKIPFELSDVGESAQSVTQAEGRSSWDFWEEGYGSLESMSDITDDHEGASGVGADRMLSANDGSRLTLIVETLTDLPEPVVGPDPDDPVMAPGKPGVGPDDPGNPDDDPNKPAVKPITRMERDPDGGAIILVTSDQELDGPVGAVRQLRLGRHSDVLHSHEWIEMSFLAVASDEPLHRYEVRYGTAPIVDEETFITQAKPAKTASDDDEGAVALDLPVDVPSGKTIRSELGNLVAETHYYVAVRARDRFNRYGPISVAQVDTTERTFATVTPCFVATAAFGTPLATEVSALRRFRDRHLLNSAPGRALVHVYYQYGAALARPLREHEWLRSFARAWLRPVVAVARFADDDR